MTTQISGSIQIILSNVIIVYNSLKSSEQKLRGN